jgi:hypothetical protein
VSIFVSFPEKDIRVNLSKKISILLWTAILIGGLMGIPSFAAEMEIPVLDAELGTCSVLFTVKDPENKPVYAAKIRTVIHYGFLSIRSLSLEIGTNGDGKAKITGLPRTPKKRFEFDIMSGNFHKQAASYPSSRCEEDKIDITFEPQDAPKTE